MRLLLDSHTLLWSLSDVPRLGEVAREAIRSPGNEVFVSAVSMWELGAKRRKGQLNAPGDLVSIVERRGFTPLPLSLFHAEQATNLPMHHRDPFDRMLVAQAQAEGLTIVTADAALRRYGVRTMPADE